MAKEMTYKQFATLGILIDLHAEGWSNVPHRVVDRPYTAASTIKALEKRGFIQVWRVDGRADSYYVTKEGRAAFKALQAKWESDDHAAPAALTATASVGYTEHVGADGSRVLIAQCPICNEDLNDDWMCPNGHPVALSELPTAVQDYVNTPAVLTATAQPEAVTPADLPPFAPSEVSQAERDGTLWYSPAEMREKDAEIARLRSELEAVNGRTYSSPEAVALTRELEAAQAAAAALRKIADAVLPYVGEYELFVSEAIDDPDLTYFDFVQRFLDEESAFSSLERLVSAYRQYAGKYPDAAIMATRQHADGGE